MHKLGIIIIILVFGISLTGCVDRIAVPTGVKFHNETLVRIDDHGDNWCITWTADGSQVTSMDDGNWLNGPYSYHNHLYRIVDQADGFTREDIPGYPQFTSDLGGWFGYGVLSVGDNIYSMVSRTPGPDWDGPFRGIKMLKSPDIGETWYRVNGRGEERLLDHWDTAVIEDLSIDEMFFFEEAGLMKHGEMGYPFSFCSFAQQGQANSAASDEYIYIYSPEGTQANLLLLARVPNDKIEQKDKWEYFTAWDGDEPVWTSDLEQRGVVCEFPEMNKAGEYFGWYSWLPSVVWNPGLKLYIMVNGGTYAGHGLTGKQKDYYDSWMHTKTGSLGFWYSENPFGPWKQFFYTDYWTVDNEKNRTYQPKLSPKWISEDGTEMVLIWSDAMENEQGRSHTVNYHWNQMNVTLEVNK